MDFPFQLDDSQDIELFPHQPGHFCPDMTCPDKEDKEAINTLHGWVQDGLMTEEERDRFYRGKAL